MLDEHWIIVGQPNSLDIVQKCATEGATHWSDCESRIADDSEVHGVRCCSSTEISGFSNNYCPTVWQESDVGGIDGCHVNYKQSIFFCRFAIIRRGEKDQRKIDK